MYLGLGFKSSCICWFGVRACVCMCVRACVCVFVCCFVVKGVQGWHFVVSDLRFFESLLCWGFTVYLGLQGSGVRVWF